MHQSTKHLPFAELADLAERRATTELRAASASHLSSCEDCAAGLQRLEQVFELMRADKATDAPRDALAFAINVFKDRQSSQAPSLLRKIVAALSFDSSQNFAPAFGVRSAGASAARQLIYSAAETDIDLRISSADNQWTVAGQVLGEDCVGGRVQLEGADLVETTALNDVCEFTLPPVSAGSYTLRLRYGKTEVEISQLTLGA